MIKSMTGYGRGEFEAQGQKWVVELRSVNHRFLELALNIPKHLWPLEDRIRQLIKSRLARGRVEMQLSYEATGPASARLRLDEAMLAEVRRLLQNLKNALEITEPLRLENLLPFWELILPKNREAPDLEETWNLLSPALTAALDALEDMRRREGAALQAEMLAQLHQITQEVAHIASHAARLPALWRDKLANRLQEVLAEGPLDETRLVQELAWLAERRDISEELARLDSHLQQCRQALLRPEPVGRRLEFLCQEMLREINTIGAKANELQIAQAVLAVKGCLERLREQVQNVE